MTNAEAAPKTELKVYKVPADNLPQLQERIEKLNKRAAKLEVQPIVLKVGEPIREEKKVVVKDGFGGYERDPGTGMVLKETVISIFYPVEVEGQAPKYAGWTLMAALQLISANGENEAAMFIRTVPGQTLPASFRHADQKCDHCGTIRRRSETFVVRHEDGTLKQVGRQCIADFLGHQDPERYAQIAEWGFSVSEACGEAEEEGWGGGGGRESIWLADYLSYVAMCVRTDGWLSRSKARELPESDRRSPTADNALGAMFAKPSKEQPHPPRPEAEDIDLSGKAIEWLRTGLAKQADLNDYQHNLAVICTRDVVVKKGFGVAASLISAYKREMGFMTERKARVEREGKSEFFGEVGKREVWKLTVLKVIDLQSDFGASHLHRFMDEKGNVATWFSSSQSLEIGKTYQIRGTVKKFEEYKGVKQTMLTRCSIETEWTCPLRHYNEDGITCGASTGETCGIAKGSWSCLECHEINAPEAKHCKCGHNLKSWRCNKCYQYNVQKAKTCQRTVQGPDAGVCGAPKSAWICVAYGCRKANDSKAQVCSCGHDRSGFKVEGGQA